MSRIICPECSSEEIYCTLTDYETFEIHFDEKLLLGEVTKKGSKKLIHCTDCHMSYCWDELSELYTEANGEE